MSNLLAKYNAEIEDIMNTYTSEQISQQIEEDIKHVKAKAYFDIFKVYMSSAFGKEQNVLVSLWFTAVILWSTLFDHAYSAGDITKIYLAIYFVFAIWPFCKAMKYIALWLSVKMR